MAMKVLPLIRQLAAEIVLDSSSAQSLNLCLILRNGLKQNGFSLLQSDELAEQWIDKFQQEIDNILFDWDELGIPRPCIPTQAPNTLLTYQHSKYEEEIEGQKLPKDYGNIYDQIASLSPRQFLLVSAALLVIAGCDAVFITDTSGDAGIDCIGHIYSGPCRSTCLFVQAKATKHNINKNTVQLEYQKFSDLRENMQFTNYLAALGKGASSDGLSICYILATNAEFEQTARDFCRRKEVLLRSRRQIAFWLSQNYDANSLTQLIDDFGDKTNRDLHYNWVPVISPYQKA